jgi:hypothetical protein
VRTVVFRNVDVHANSDGVGEACVPRLVVPEIDDNVSEIDDVDPNVLETDEENKGDNDEATEDAGIGEVVNDVVDPKVFEVDEDKDDNDEATEDVGIGKVVNDGVDPKVFEADEDEVTEVEDVGREINDVVDSRTNDSDEVIDDEDIERGVDNGDTGSDEDEAGEFDEFDNDELGNDVVVIDDVKFKIGDDELKEGDDSVDDNRVVGREAFMETGRDLERDGDVELRFCGPPDGRGEINAVDESTVEEVVLGPILSVCSEEVEDGSDMGRKTIVNRKDISTPNVRAAVYGYFFA